jgi:hypothetical protein
VTRSEAAVAIVDRSHQGSDGLLLQELAKLATAAAGIATRVEGTVAS